MVYVYPVLLFLFRWNICSAETTRNETFCENGRDLQLSCLQNEVISYISVTNGMNNIDPSKTSNCMNSRTCTISTDIFTSIKRISICIYTEYYCDCPVWPYEKTILACSGSLHQITCPSFFGCEIAITSVSSFPDDTVCPQPKCNLYYKLMQLCNRKSKCEKLTDDACLFHPRYVHVQYTCKETSSRPWNTLDSTHDIDTSIETSDTPAIDSTDINSSVKEMSKPVLLQDVDGRVLIHSTTENKNVTVCGTGWDDEDAMVVCRYLYSSHGQAKCVNEDSNYETIPYAIHCTGNETDPFLCNYTYLHDGCNTSIVAAVSCSKDTNTTNQFSRHDAYDALSNIGAAAGVSVGVIVLICIAVTVFLLIKRSRLTNKDKLYSSDITNGDYIGNQAIALPNTPNISKQTHSNDDAGRQNKRHDVNSHNLLSDNNLSSASFSLNSLETGTIKTEQVNGRYEYAKSNGEDMHNALGDTYACSEEGVYDKAKNNRHVQTELNVYSHSIDSVYDTSDRNRNQEHTMDTYDHFFGQKNDNNYDIAIKNNR